MPKCSNKCIDNIRPGGAGDGTEKPTWLGGLVRNGVYPINL